MLGRRALGIAVIVAAALIVVLATVRPNPFKETHTVMVRFDRVQGLGKIDRNVRVAGGNTGEVGKVERTGDDVLVELELNQDVPVRKDARVELRPHTLFEGSAFVDLHLGTPNAPLLEPGAEIPKSQTQVYISLDEAIRVFNKDNRQAIKELVGSGSQILRDEGVSGLQRTFKHAPALTRELGPTARALQGRRGHELAGAIRGLARTSHAVASKEDELVPFARRANRTLQALDVGDGAALDAAVVALPDALEELDRSDEQLVALVDQITELAVDLRPAARELPPLLRGSRPLLRRSIPIIRKSTPLVRGLRIILARASDAAPALHRAVLALQPGAKILQESVLPALNRPTLFGVPSYAQLGSAFAGLSSGASAFQTPTQSRNPGHIIRTGAYLDPEGTAVGGTLPTCATIEVLNKELAARLGALGLCQR